MLKKILAVIIALTAILQVQAAPPSDTCKQETWVTNGPVNAVCPAGDKVYIGGQFTMVGPYTGAGVPIGSATGIPSSIFPKISGTVQAVCADGSGGWFVGGQFTFVDGVARNNIAHILSNGTLDLYWSPNSNGAVLALAVSGTTVFAGGAFTSIGAQTRNFIAALDANTGNATDWNPNADDCVRSLTVRGTTVYVGGHFTSIGGQTRNRIAALDATTGNATAWNPNSTNTWPVYSGRVYCIIISGTTVYVGGDFDSIGGQGRKYIAALDATTGNALAWNPSANHMVEALTLSGTTIYTGGGFTSIGGQTRNYIAALDATTGNATAWNPSANSIVYALAASGPTVYAGGQFTGIGGQTRNHIAALDTTAGNALSWNPDANYLVLSLAVNGTTVYAGGGFTCFGAQTCSNFAKLNATTGIAYYSSPGFNAPVSSIAVSGRNLYVGGNFTRGIVSYFAVMDTGTGMDLTWANLYDLNGPVSSIAVSGTTIYVGGNFTKIGGQFRSGFAALDLSTGSITALNPGVRILSFAVSGPTLYVGGSFNSIGGQSRIGIAALDAITGSATAWNPNANGTVSSIAVSGTTVYVGGQFTSIGGSYRNNIAALDATTGIATGWDPNANNPVNALAVSGPTVYAAGEYLTSIGGQSRYRIAALDTITGIATGWNPNANGTVSSIAVSGTTVYTGGAFTNIGQGVGYPYFAQFGNFYSAPVVQSITPSSVINNAVIQITNLSGSNFRSGATVKLTKAGQADINATNVSVVSSTQIACTVDITNAAAGAWGVVVANEDTKSDTLLQGFTVTSPPPVLISPANTATDLSLTPTLTWYKAVNDSLYTVQLSNNSGFSSILVNNNLVSDTFFSMPSSILSNNTPYFWRACITKKGGEVTVFSAPWTFTTVVAAPGTATLASPSNSVTNQPISLSLTWSAVTGATTYHVQLSTSSSFTDTLVNDSTLSLTTKAVGPLSTGATYYWRANAKNSGGTSAWSTVWSFTTIPPAPTVPTLFSPANTAVNQPLNLSLTWLAVSGASTYRVQMSTSASFSDTVVDDSTLTTTSKSVGPLSTSKTYYWRVNAKNPGGTSAWSGIWSFGTIPPVAGAPVPLSPANSTQNQQLNLTLSWNAVTGAATYRAQLATDTGFTSIVADDSTLTAPTKAIGPLSTGTTYYWRINAKNPGGTSVWSEKWSFTTIPPAPGAPILVSLSDNTVNSPITPMLIWNRAIGAVTYRLQIGADSLFNTIIMQDSTLTDTSKSCAALTNDTKNFWHVNATNPGGTGAWSAVRRFTTIVALPSAVNLKTLATGDTVKADSVFLAWSAGTPKVDRYSVEYATDSSFTSPTIDTTVSDTVKLVRSLQNNTTFWWKVKAHNAEGWGDWSATNAFAVKLITTHARPATVPKTFSFSVFGRANSIRYALPKSEHVSMRVYSVNGQLQSEPVNMQQAAGYYTVNMQRSAYAAGSYLVVFRAGNYYQKKMIFLMK
jgi:hypothetical protein